MKAVFRVDSSAAIGFGHLMRCLTLADELAKYGVSVVFIARKHDGNLNFLVHEKKYQLYELSQRNNTIKGNNMYGSWLGASWQQDAAEVSSLIERVKPDFLIVDHYSLGAEWESEVSKHCKKIIVIDDLANRAHVCDILIDQTCDRHRHEYAAYVDKNCMCLLGSSYAILRPEFARLRSSSLHRRKSVEYKKILVSLGGVDQKNITAEVLSALTECGLTINTEVTIVLGHNAPHKEAILNLAGDVPYRARVLSGVSNMGKLMEANDFSIGAAGSSAWERCCLGLPTIMIVIADNQLTVAKNLEKKGAAILLKKPIKEGLSQLFSGSVYQQLRDVSTKSAQLVDGLGCVRIINELKIKV